MPRSNDAWPEAWPEDPTPTPRSLPPARSRTRRPVEPAKADEAFNQPETPVESAPQSGEPVPPDQDESGYPVGYGKPPKDTRFKPGQSGNPKGRPRGAKGLNTLVRQNLTQKVAVRTPNGEKKITRIEAVIHKTLEQAMKGNARAIAELLKLYSAAVPEERAPDHSTAQSEDLTAADLAILEDYRRALTQAPGEEQ